MKHVLNNSNITFVIFKSRKEGYMYNIIYLYWGMTVQISDLVNKKMHSCFV